MPVKTILIPLWLLLSGGSGLVAQAANPNTSNQVIEGGKLVVELIKVFTNKKETERDPDCKNSHADLCVHNQSNSSLIVSLSFRQTGETREVVVLPGGRECSLQLRLGVWTYELKIPGSPLPMRKGDVLIEACNNIAMTIK